MEKVTIKPVAQRYAKDDFKIFMVTVVDQKESEILENGMTISIVGEMPSLSYNKEYGVVGDFETNRYGPQLKVGYVSEVFEETDVDMQKLFLREILTEKQYNDLVTNIKDPFKAIKDKDIKVLTSVKGVGEIVAWRIIEKYQKTIDYSSVFIKFGKLGLSSTMIKKISDSYASPQMLIEKFDDNPYILADEIKGIGFKTADGIALKNGISELSADRVSAYIVNRLNGEAQSLGDTYLLTQELYEQWVDYSDIVDCKDNFKVALRQLLDSETIVLLRNNKFISLRRYYDIEDKLAEEFLRLADKTIMKEIKNHEEILNEVEKQQGFKFNYEQRTAILQILDNNVVVIAGSAGVGKTSVARAIVDLIGRLMSAATALSGKAGQRLSETTGITGQTIHRLLGYNPSMGFTMNSENMLDLELIVVDESSMIDVGLFKKLLEAIPSGCKLVVLGDTHQLQSIGAGNVLLDLIQSDAIKSMELEEIHRQARMSGIIDIATKVRNGEKIITSDTKGVEIIGELQDCKLNIFRNVPKGDTKPTKSLIAKEFKELLDAGHDISDIQVIVPMKTRGDACTRSLNEELQQLYNPTLEEDGLQCGKGKDEYVLKVGDKVICKKNNYKTTDPNGEIVSIFNGSMGIIESIDLSSSSMIIDFYNIGRIIVDKSTKRTIELAYAITIHSSQGSQWKSVIVGIDNSMYAMLNKELLYTAITRAEQYCAIIGENKAIGQAIRTSNLYIRRTLLKKFIKKHSKIVENTDVS